MNITSNYYRVREHRIKCEICSFSRDIRLNINRRMLREDTLQSLIQFVNYRFPIYRTDDILAKKLEEDMSKHKSYMDWLVQDVQTKSMYRVIDNQEILDKINNIDNITIHEKTHLIMDIEDILNKEYPDMEQEKLSMLSSITKVTLPILMNRLNRELDVGRSKDAKDMISSLSVMIDSVNELQNEINARKNKNDENEDKDKDNEDKPTDKHINENESPNIDENVGENLISLSDRIRQAVNNK